jgi:hypothetical protein
MRRGTLYLAALAVLGPACGDDAEIRLSESPGAGSAGASACTSSEQCGGGEPFCELGRGQCVECLTLSHCEPTKACTLSGQCEDACVTDNDCASGSGNGRCDLARGACVDCLGDADCDGPKPFCHPLSQRCVACVGDIDCANDPGKPFCAMADGECGACLNDAHCPASLRCDTKSHDCGGDD